MQYDVVLNNIDLNFLRKKSQIEFNRVIIDRVGFHLNFFFLKSEPESTC